MDDDRVPRRGDDARPGPWRPFVKPGKNLVLKLRCSVECLIDLLTCKGEIYI